MIKITKFASAALALALLGGALAAPVRVSAQGVLLKDIAKVQGVTANQFVGYGVVVGLNQTGDSTTVHLHEQDDPEHPADVRSLDQRRPTSARATSPPSW